ncbi:PHP domain-containing protein [Desulfocurvibacter africanus]|uniref:PHP domain protein n=1 Tax=Desulfocurvibacter africanus subsp. africanus str. Walvis Bay TaxID=690850 RepID=F3YXM3_DESAF|nr:PHP domain-containing protein [Desulfocurvibacter africanus]EGJ49467.1 PHP domain protein [Desulfocurvibacter africanus subsp. africanus str. Walvis Bay]
MLFDLHLHTTRYSGCSALSPRRACELALERGLHGLVITEHRIRWPEAELATLREASPGLLLLSGMEVTLVEGHDVVLLGDALPERSPRFMRTRDLEGMLAPVREQVFAFVAHPFRYTDARDKRLERILALVDGIEMSSVNILRAGFSGKDTYVSSAAALYEQARRDFGLVPVWATDAHSEETVGALATQIPGRVESMADLVAALKSGGTQEHQNSKLLRRILS